MPRVCLQSTKTGEEKRVKHKNILEQLATAYPSAVRACKVGIRANVVAEIGPLLEREGPHHWRLSAKGVQYAQLKGWLPQEEQCELTISA